MWYGFIITFIQTFLIWSTEQHSKETSNALWILLSMLQEVINPCTCTGFKQTFKASWLQMFFATFKILFNVHVLYACISSNLNQAI